MKNSFAENLKMARKARGMSQAQLAEKAGIPRSTYCCYETGRRTPDYDMLVMLATELEISLDELFGLDQVSSSNLIRESKAQYYVTDPKYTLEEYFRLVDCADYELMEGELIHRNTPTYEHQQTVLVLGMEFQQYIRGKKGKCKVVPAPFSVVLSEENATVLQPDLSIICNRDQIRDGMCFGPPDIVVEVLSESNRKYDLNDKFAIYNKYDVREYWVTDVVRKVTVIYDLEGGDIPRIIPFAQKAESKVLEGFSVCIEEILDL